MSPYSGIIVTEATDLDVDHMVPMKNAHDSGGCLWNSQTKQAYANDLSTENHLIEVTAFENRSKGSKGPEAWRPSNVRMLSWSCG